MGKKRGPVILNVRLIDLEKVTIEELEKIEKELKNKERYLKERINDLLTKDG